MNTAQNELNFTEVKTAEDLNEAYNLLNACFVADKHPPIGEHAWLDLVHGGRKSYYAFLVKSQSHRHAIGYLHISKGNNNNWAIDYVIHPHHRDPNGTTASSIIKKAIQIIKDCSGGHVHLWVSKPNDTTDIAAYNNGFSKGRDLYQMTVNLPVVANIKDINTRAFVVNKDEQDWLDLNNKAFLNHPEQGNWDLKTLQARFDQPWFDPEDILIYEENGKMLAFCWVKIHHEKEPPAGEIYIVAVDPESQGKQLGKRIVYKALQHMHKKNLTKAFLYVDSRNAAALKIYKDLGFVIDHIDRAYTIDL
jgi:mycothiol synthase